MKYLVIFIYIILFGTREMLGNNEYNYNTKIPKELDEESVKRGISLACKADIYTFSIKRNKGIDGLDIDIINFDDSPSSPDKTLYTDTFKCAFHGAGEAAFSCTRVAFQLSNCGHRLYKVFRESPECPSGYVLVMSGYNSTIRHPLFVDITNVSDTTCKDSEPCADAPSALLSSTGLTSATAGATSAATIPTTSGELPSEKSEVADLKKKVAIFLVIIFGFVTVNLLVNVSCAVVYLWRMRKPDRFVLEP